MRQPAPLPTVTCSLYDTSLPCKKAALFGVYDTPRAPPFPPHVVVGVLCAGVSVDGASPVGDVLGVLVLMRKLAVDNRGGCWLVTNTDAVLDYWRPLPPPSPR